MAENEPRLTVNEATTEGLNLMESLAFCLLATNGEDGFPYIKAVNNMKHDGLNTIWFSTNTSSKRVRQLRNDNRASVYYVDAPQFKGLMLKGTIEILQDPESRKMLWSDGAEMFYPLGVEDPDYSVLCFTAAQANYYNNLKNVSFDIA